MTDTLAPVAHDLVTLSDYVYGRLRERIDGLTDEEYFWEPAANSWSVRRGPDGAYRIDGVGSHPEPAPLTTIAWRLCHIIDLVGADRNATWLGLEPPPRQPVSGEPATARDATLRLEQAYARFRSCLTGIDTGTLLDPLGPIARQFGGDTRLAFILHELDELIHHGAEVGTMRDLFRAMHQKLNPGQRFKPA